MSPYVVPDRVLERNLPSPLTQTFWGDLTIVSFDALDPPQTSVIPENHVLAQRPALSEEPVNTSTPPFKRPVLLDRPHYRYFFDDGNITFRVQGRLYRVHRYLFSKSSEFKDRFSRLSTQQEPLTIPLEDVKAVDFDAFLSILYPQSYNTLERRTFEEWSSILDLSTRWGFTSIRDLAIRCITYMVPPYSRCQSTRKPPIILSQLLLARKHAVEHWIVPALLELCERPEPLSLEEARLMDFKDVLFVGSVRQTVRSPTLMVRGGGIRNCIQAWKIGEPWSLGSESPGHLVHEPQGDTPPTGGEIAEESGNPLPDGLENSEEPFPEGPERPEPLPDPWGPSNRKKKCKKCHK